jgi:hypothetical protein
MVFREIVESKAGTPAAAIALQVRLPMEPAPPVTRERFPCCLE